MIWYTAYLIVGLVVAAYTLFDIRNMRRHVEECEHHHEARGFLDKLDEHPQLLPLLVCFMILLWPIAVAMFLLSFFGGDDDNNDPQSRVPVEYR